MFQALLSPPPTHKDPYGWRTVGQRYTARPSEEEAQEFVENLELALARSRNDRAASSDAGEDLEGSVDEGEQAECSRARHSSESLPLLWQSSDDGEEDED